jgi:hypothetical protein
MSLDHIQTFLFVSHGFLEISEKKRRHELEYVHLELDPKRDCTNTYLLLLHTVRNHTSFSSFTYFPINSPKPIQDAHLCFLPHLLPPRTPRSSPAGYRLGLRFHDHLSRPRERGFNIATGTSTLLGRRPEASAVSEDQVGHYADGYADLLALAKGENYTQAARNSALLSCFA